MSLFIVGLGPGGPEHRTAAAERAVREADVVVGYGPYVDQCADLLDAQEVVRGRMGEELERAREAVERARSARVALVSSGDAGVHGMAARTLAMAEGIEVTVVPGVTAALATAARLGAPLADDWATLSLSDLHLPLETVERRLTGLAMSGIALALYNPRSKTRTEPFDRALAILREHRAADTPVVVATDVAREGETLEHTTLATLDPTTVTMRSLVLVAGETAHWSGEWLVALRDLAPDARRAASLPAVAAATPAATPPAATPA
ncbi:precorrin-3B C(17)-methyltransferase, partial [Solirubrobacter phytolaccae]